MESQKKCCGPKSCEKTSWSDLSQNEQYAVIGGAAVELVLKLTAWHFLYHDPKEKIRGSKWAWFPVTLVNFIGPLAFLLFGRKK